MGTMDTWIDCATADSNREWDITKSGAGDANWILNLQIRHQVSMIVYGDANISLELIDNFS